MGQRVISRRRFLAGAAAAGGGVLAGAAGLRVAPPVLAAGTAADIDLDGLRRALTGRLLRPGDSDYAGAARPWNLALPTRSPLAIAQVADSADVVACVQRAGGRGAPLAARSGGHSYAGYSTPDGGVVVDVSALNGVAVRDDGTAVIGAGARLIDVYAALAAHGRALPGGTCSTVGIAGLTLGGGIGVLTRPYGLTCDHLKGATVVTADGSVHRVDGNREPELLWALRGGGGGHAGIVTDFTFGTVPVPSLTTFTVSFPAARTAAVLRAWSAWLHAAPDGLTSTCVVGSGAAPSNEITGTWIGDSAGLTDQLAQLVTEVGTDPSRRSSTPMGYLDAMKYYAGCADKTINGCHLDTTPGGTIPRESFHAASRMLTHVLGHADADRVVAAMRSRTDMVLLFDSMGGQVGQLGVDDTAFPHRAAHASVQIYTWNRNGAEAVEAAQQALTPVIGSGSYVNYLNPGQADWAQSYWGEHRGRLRQIVSSFDPTGVFTFPQSVLRS
jgi:FAD/FMN-containing dehydrogenase